MLAALLLHGWNVDGVAIEHAWRAVIHFPVDICPYFQYAVILHAVLVLSLPDKLLAVLVVAHHLQEAKAAVARAAPKVAVEPRNGGVHLLL